MSVYEFAPARLNDRTQLVLQVLVAVITVGAIGALLVAAWPSSSTRWIQISLVVLSVAIAATFNYRGSSIDRLFAFGFTATILASLGPFANPVFAVTAWMLGVLIGQWVQHRSFLLGTESTMYMGLAAGALVAVWQLTDQWLGGGTHAAATSESPVVLQFLFDLHIPQIFTAICAYYVVRTIGSLVRARILTHLTFREVWARMNWVRVVTMFAAEFLVAALVEPASTFLNATVFQENTPYGKTTLIIIIATTVFGLSSKRQARTARQRLNSLTEAALQLPWPADRPVREQAVAFAKQTLPAYDITACTAPEPLTQDHIISIPIEEPDQNTVLLAVRRTNKPPFRVEDQRALTAIAQVANATIRGRSEVRRLHRLANTDRLTGLLNYRAFQLALDELRTEHRGDELVALIFIDVDNFKSINDTYGHEAGNVVLATVAERIHSVIAEPNLVARVGGDEFAVLLRHLRSGDEIDALQSKIQSKVARPIAVEGAIVSLRISQGVALSEPGQADLTRLVDIADRRMYESRGSTLIAPQVTAPVDADADADLGIVLSLREGILDRRLKFVYQPIVDLRTRRTVAVEALVRYTDPVHGEVPVSLLLSEAERFGLLPELSEQLLELSFAALDRVRQEFPGLRRMHLNVSLEQILSDKFTDLVAEQCEAQPGVELVLEVHEGSLHTVSPEVIARVADFVERSPSTRLAVDDIGRAYTGLAILRDLPFATWKMDKSVAQNFQNERATALTRALVLAGNSLGAEIVFEGIETEAQHDWLLGLGATLGQGFLYGHPMPAEELTDWLAYNERAAVE